jgi:hypothetical protein
MHSVPGRLSAQLAVWKLLPLSQFKRKAWQRRTIRQRAGGLSGDVMQQEISDTFSRITCRALKVARRRDFE